MASRKNNAPAGATSRITRLELIAEARENRLPDRRPEPSLDRIHLQLSTVLDVLFEDLDYRSNPESSPAVFARCLAAIPCNIEDAPRVGRQQ